MIAIIDYGMGNLGSVAKAFKAIGADVKVTTSPKDLEKASKIVLPGVGAFRYAMRCLTKLRIITVLKREIEKGKPYLGLCLGMQLLFDESQEDGRSKGLGIFKGQVERFKFTSGKRKSLEHSYSSRSRDQIFFENLKVPHMGWNQIIKRPATPPTPRLRRAGSDPAYAKASAGRQRPAAKECPLLKNIPDGAWMYFVHSYYVAPKDKSIIAATTDYGIDFASMIWKDNIFATQFHPEKSQAVGLKMMENFVKL